MLFLSSHAPPYHQTKNGLFFDFSRHFFWCNSVLFCTRRGNKLHPRWNKFCSASSARLISNDAPRDRYNPRGQLTSRSSESESTGEEKKKIGIFSFVRKWTWRVTGPVLIDRCQKKNYDKWPFPPHSQKLRVVWLWLLISVPFLQSIVRHHNKMNDESKKGSGSDGPDVSTN